VSPSRNWQGQSVARALEIDPSEEENLSNEYMQKKIIHGNRYYTEKEQNTLP